MSEKNPVKIIAEPGKQEIIITRTFDAPRQLVFKVMTDPSSIPEWWGPKYLTTVVQKMDVKPGGIWRIVQRDSKGNEYGFHGVYHDLKPPEWIVYTFEFEGAAGHVMLETVKLEEIDDKTLYTDISVFQSVNDRDQMLKAGMEDGAIETLERLDELLKKQLIKR